MSRRSLKRLDRPRDTERLAHMLPAHILEAAPVLAGTFLQAVGCDTDVAKPQGVSMATPTWCAASHASPRANGSRHH